MKLLDFEKEIYEMEKSLEELREIASKNPAMLKELNELEKELKEAKKRIYKNLNAWQIVQIARHPERPHAIDYIENLFEDFIELHGDRVFGDDPAIIAGVGKFNSYNVAFVAEEKGREVHERIKRNFGMPHPEGYRKAQRIFDLAEKFGLPVITFVDTPGAYPGIGAEERGQAMAIATSIKKMLNIKVPVVAVIIGEGGSGGALAIAAADRVLALKYSIYSVISPEGCAAIIWKDGAKAPQAAEILKLTAQDLYGLKVVDEIIDEGLEGAHKNSKLAIENTGKAIKRHLEELLKIPPTELLEKRHKRFLSYGFFKEVTG